MVGVAAGPHALGLVYMAHERARRAGPLAVQTVAPGVVSGDAATRAAPAPSATAVPMASHPTATPVARAAPMPVVAPMPAASPMSAATPMPAAGMRTPGASAGTFEPTVGAGAGPTPDDMESMAALRKLAMSVRRTSLRQPA